MPSRIFCSSLQKALRHTHKQIGEKERRSIVETERVVEGLSSRGMERECEVYRGRERERERV